MAAHDEGADRHAQLVEQIRRDQLAEQVGPAFDENPAVAKLGQRVDGRLGAHVLLAGDDDVRGLRRGGDPVFWRLARGKHDGLRQRFIALHQLAVKVKTDTPGHNRDRRRGRAAFPQLRPHPARLGEAVPLGASGARADKNHVGEASQYVKQQTVGGAGQPA